MSETPAQPAFFHGVEPRAWNRPYRVYVLPGELVFIRAGSAGVLSGRVSAYLGWVGLALNPATVPTKKNASRQEELNNSSLDALINDHKHNFRINIADVEDACLDPCCFW